MGTMLELGIMGIVKTRWQTQTPLPECVVVGKCACAIGQNKDFQDMKTKITLKELQSRNSKSAQFGIMDYG